MLHVLKLESFFLDPLKQAAAARVIQTRTADLTNAIKAALPAIIGDQLVQSGLISQDIMDFETGLSMYEKAQKIMKAVSTHISLDPKSIMNFIQVLEDSKDPSCNKQARKMSKASMSLM